MSSFWLKLIAIAAMTCDHLGAVFFPNEIWMRVIGRMTMPIMSYLVAVGYAHTRDVKRYMLRLLAFGAVSIVPFALAFWMYGGNIPTPFTAYGRPLALTLDVMFTLFLGLCALWAMDNAKGVLRPLIVAGAVALSYFCDWPVYGVLLVLGFGLARQDKVKTALALIGVVALMFGVDALGGALASGYFHIGPYTLVTLGMLIDLPLLWLYNGKRGWDMRWMFYAYYPAHLLVIGLVNILR